MIRAFKRRMGQLEFVRGVRRHRITGLLARRQYGKTTIAGDVSLLKMMETKNHTVVFGSVKVDLGREIVRKEAGSMQKAFSLLVEQAKEANGLLDVVDGDKGKSVATINMDDWADLYEASRLEFRYYHSRTVYSRTKVVALNPAAVGETGDLIMDEVGRVRDFAGVWEAVKPIISSNPEFRCLLTTTPPPDDTHYSFGLLAPPIGAELPVNPRGNWYRSELGVWVLRITAFDAYADGVPLYDDDTGAAISPDQSYAMDHDKDAWRRNYGCEFLLGGTGACGLQQLDSAQRRGIGKCALFVIHDDLEFFQALAWLSKFIGDGKVGLGWDLATTTKETSNPSSFSVVEDYGVEVIVRAIFVWKTADPDKARERARQIIQVVAKRKAGGRARRLCIDATNERYFAQDCRKELAAELPVELVIGSESIEIPGEEDPLNMKQFLGGQLVGELDDNHLTLPPERYLKEDWRGVKKEKGMFVCIPDGEGRHGDTFDSTKLGFHACRSTGGAIESTEGIVLGGHQGKKLFKPRRLS